MKKKHFLHDISKHTIFYQNRSINEYARMILALNKKYIAEKDFEILRWPYVTFNDLLGHTLFNAKLRLHNFSTYRNFYQNQFVNEYARKKKAKISESRNHGVIYWDIGELTFLKMWLTINFPIILNFLIQTKF